MYYKNHHMWTYCYFLGTYMVDNTVYDLGVYIDPRDYVSQAIVYGNKPDQYMSGPVESAEQRVTKENLRRFEAVRDAIGLDTMKAYQNFIKETSNGNNKSERD